MVVLLNTWVKVIPNWCPRAGQGRTTRPRLQTAQLSPRAYRPLGLVGMSAVSVWTNPWQTSGFYSLNRWGTCNRYTWRLQDCIWSYFPWATSKSEIGTREIEGINFIFICFWLQQTKGNLYKTHSNRQLIVKYVLLSCQDLFVQLHWNAVVIKQQFHQSYKCSVY